MKTNETEENRTNLMISRARLFNHASLAFKLNAQNANGSTIDVLATTSYLRQKGKASTDTGEANSKRYVCLLIFLFDFEMAIAITLHSELRLSSL